MDAAVVTMESDDSNLLDAKTRLPRTKNARCSMDASPHLASGDVFSFFFFLFFFFMKIYIELSNFERAVPLPAKEHPLSLVARLKVQSILFSFSLFFLLLFPCEFRSIKVTKLDYRYLQFLVESN